MTALTAKNADSRVMVDYFEIVTANKSGTITTGGTAQTLSAANSARNGFWIQNQSAGSLWIYELGAATQASPSLEIKPGQLYEYPAGGVPASAISIIGATTGQVFAAREW